MIQRHLIESDLGLNLRLHGGKGDGATVDTAAFSDALSAIATMAGSPHLYIPPGVFVLDDRLTCTTSYVRVWGPGTILLKGPGQVQLGDDDTAASHCEFQDLIFQVDASSTAAAPVRTYNVGRVVFKQAGWRDIRQWAVDVRTGVIVARHLDTRMAAGAGRGVFRAGVPSGMAAAIRLAGGRFNAGDRLIADRTLVAFCPIDGVDGSAGGEIDGLVLNNVDTEGLDHVIDARPAAGGHLSNCVVQGGLADQVDQFAYRFAASTGAAINDVTLEAGLKINGRSDSAATDGALVTLDLSGGGEHGRPFRCSSVVFANAAARGIEVLGGDYGTVQISRNIFSDYGLQDDAASRAAYIEGSFDVLEVAENVGMTTHTHDYDIEFDSGYTATQKRVENNMFGGVTANVASENP